MADNTSYEGGTFDVVVVGAGLSGLAAAVEIEKQGLSVQIVEAAGRVGGKIYSRSRADGAFYEAGAQFFNEDMPNICSLVRSYAGGEMDGALDGIESVLSNGRAVLDSEMEISGIEWDRLTEKTAPSSLSFREIIDRCHSPKERDYVARTLEELFCVDPAKLDGGGAQEYLSSYRSEKNDLTWQAKEPLSGVVDRMAAGLCRPVLFDWDARRISIAERMLQVESANSSVRAKAVVLAVPMAVADRIVLPPEIDAHVRQARNSFVPGSVVKVSYIVDAPFPEKHRVTAASEMGEIALQAVEVMPKRAGTREFVVFCGGSSASALAKLEPSRRDELMWAFFRKAFDISVGVARMSTLDEWSDDDLTGGGYASHIRRDGLPGARHLLRTFCGPILFAGTDISSMFPGYMEGAVLSGKNAAYNAIRWVSGDRDCDRPINEATWRGLSGI